MLDPSPSVSVSVSGSGQGSLRHLNMLGGEVVLDGVAAADTIVVRAHYYPAWRAYDGEREIALYSVDGQLAFQAPRTGAYSIHLVYPRYRLLSLAALSALVLGSCLLTLRPRA